MEARERFDWDEANIGHVARHAISRSEVEEALLDPDAVMLEVEVDDEDRVKSVGATSGGRIIEVVFTFRDEAIRPVTAYSATKRTEKLYLEGK